MMPRPYATGTTYPLDARAVLSGLRGEDRFVLLETARAVGFERTSYLFRKPVKVLTALTADDVDPLYRNMEEALGQGHYLAGWWTYEWGYALQPKLRHLIEVHRPRGPLVWLGVFKPPQVWSHGPGEQGRTGAAGLEAAASANRFELDTDRETYLRSVRRVQDYIARGHTYQTNYTIRGRFQYTGDPIEFYLGLRAGQAVSYAACIRDQDRWILSLSPELFFRIGDGTVETKPMKGTARRGRTVEEDERLASGLARDPKNRAENVMIVDLLRNDLGRICRPGTVRVPEIFVVERFETLFQMTSKVTGVLRPEKTWKDVFSALFPCGSVTGAPKIRTMEIIAEVESTPRGVYTGGVGFISPRGEAAFNVAIRTVVLEGGAGEIGLGSGITADSDPEAEYDECVLKGDFLSRPREDFALIETLRWEPDRMKSGGYLLLERHLARIENSAHYFGFPEEIGRISKALFEYAGGLDRGGGPRRVRLVLSRDGNIRIQSALLEHVPEPVPIALSPARTSSRDPFLYHKTTRRAVYEQEHRRGRKQGLFDCIFRNERGELTEGAVTNLFLETDCGLVTPPLDSGLLNGTFRQDLLASGRAREKTLRAEDLERAGEVYVGNSVRGLLRAFYRSTLSPG